MLTSNSIHTPLPNLPPNPPGRINGNERDGNTNPVLKSSTYTYIYI